MILSLLILAPALGALLLWLLPARLARPAAAAAMATALLLAGTVVALFEGAEGGFQMVEKAVWIGRLKVHYQLGVDGLSLFFLPATALLFLGALLTGWKTAEGARLHCSLLLLLESATLGIFCALDTLLFFVFWEATLVPLYFLLGGWGAVRESRGVAYRYFLIMLAGGVPLLFAFLLLAAGRPEAGFDLPALLAAPLPRGGQYAVFLLFLLGFGVKLPFVPLHTWLPQFAVAGPGSLAALLVGIKLGAYGLLRFAIPLAPLAARELHWLIAGLGTLALLYGAVSMLAQTNLRAVLAHAAISHAGLAVLSLAALDARGAQGAVALLLNFALCSGGALLLAEFLRQRTGSTDLASLGGVARSMPLLAGGILLCGLGGMGLPGTSGFPGELLALLAALRSHTGAGLGALFGLGVGAAAFLAFYRRAFFGPAARPDVEQAVDLRPRERAVLLLLVLLIVGLGLWPAPVLDRIAPAADAWAARLVPQAGIASR